jgi:hypothetical protein
VRRRAFHPDGSLGADGPVERFGKGQGALAIFLLAPGPGGSPFPGSAAKSFAARIGYIPLNIVYTILLAASLRPGPEA